MDRKEGVTKQPVWHECKVSIYHVPLLIISNIVAYGVFFDLLCTAIAPVLRIARECFL